MAANKFATLLHRNTNTVVVTLVYAVLEWVLILLLLLNSLFSYLITRFAKWVGLKPPCLLCSRLDHVLEPESKSKVLQSDAVCETHAAEISKMGFCSIHGKMAETQSMCEDCLVSIRGMAFVSWFSEKSERCSCCDKSLRTTYTSKETLIVEASDDDDEDEDEEEGEEEGDRECDHQILFDVESFILREVAEDRSNSSVSKDAEKDEKEDDLIIITDTDPISECHHLLHRFSESVWEDRSFDCISMRFETNVDDKDQRVIPVELIDSFTSANFGACKSEDGVGKKDQKIETLASESSIEAELSMKDHMVLEQDDEGLKNDGDNAESAMEKQDDEQAFECTQEDQTSSSDDDAEVQNAFDEFLAQNNICQSQSLFCGDNNIETTPEEADDTQDNLPQSEEPSCSCECIEEDQSLTSDDDAEVPDAFDKFIAQNSLGMSHSHSFSCLVETGANDEEDADLSLADENHEETSHNHSSKSCAEDEVEEDKLPETPSSVDGLHYLHGKMLLYEKTESGDGSEIENGDSVSTIEQLKTALKAERKTLSALYQELEEERSASAIAANQTMAMITRLQEEKAAMQMEALQYQRMMEEQSEYDQEALQLLNDLMVKREKEKKELEKELEEYKQKVMDFEAKEKLRVLRRMKMEVIEVENPLLLRLWVKTLRSNPLMNCEPREEDNINTTTSTDTVSSLEEMTMDCVKHMNALDSSLAEFEEEKLSILDQLKALEEKLITLGDKEQLLDDLNQNSFFSSPEEDMCCNNVYSDDKQCHSPRMPMASLAKRLLPFLDAVNDDETEESYSCGRQEENSGGPIDNATMKVSIEEEVDHVYEKLQALETDTEFLKNCMGSTEQGDQKGMDLLQDILLHLRDLKAVELRLNQLGDDDPLR
ncbi:LOW QUALITY PROTEIN: myosin-binding protein 3-like [Neltuma alba]|uniref:LOW QUALITY PROTEIN: myosin-binding protein 3-like n=1 Tax=Neltuma alba TaxID=207710 RepID=UPI0010A2ED1A|nr:LOW QUALITY PROTEIN: myosin-binding protein 3-like [Prosopis alba]